MWPWWDLVMVHNEQNTFTPTSVFFFHHLLIFQAFTLGRETEAITDTLCPSGWNDVDTSCNHPTWFLSKHQPANNYRLPKITRHHHFLFLLLLLFKNQLPTHSWIRSEGHLTLHIFSTLQIDYGGDFVKLDKAEQKQLPLRTCAVPVWHFPLLTWGTFAHTSHGPADQRGHFLSFWWWSPACCIAQRVLQHLLVRCIHAATTGQ